MEELSPKQEYEKRSVEMQVEFLSAFNFAQYINNGMPIRGIRFTNRSETPVEGLSLVIYADYAFFTRYEQALDPLPPGRDIEIGAPVLEIRSKKIAWLDEATTTMVTAELRLNGEIISSAQREMKILPYNQTPGFLHMVYLPAFILPNHPVVVGLMHDASEILRLSGKDPSLEGYQKKDPNRVLELAWAAYAAIQRLNVAYANPPANFADGQRVRTPELILSQRLGTCLDMTLLYAALLESIGLNPVLYVLTGHIICGVWLTEKSFSEVCLNGNGQIRKLIHPGAGELVFVETTTMCAGETRDFDTALVPNTDAVFTGTDFRVAVDVRQARNRGVKPIPSRTLDGTEYQIDYEEREPDELSRAPKYRNIVISEAPAAGKKPVGKREEWESRLLDLSTHNTLLNLPKNHSVERLLSSGIAEIEDALSCGEEFRIFPTPEWISDLRVSQTDENGKRSETTWLHCAEAQQGYYELTDWQADRFDLGSRIREEYRSRRLYTFCTAKELDRSLTGIFRSARAAKQENGVSNLYLAMGLLRWYETTFGEAGKSGDAHYAPLVLVPVDIRRLGANQGYSVCRRDDEPYFNTTLLELLRQKYEIEIPGLDPLPQDEYGINISQIFAIVRSALLNVPDWNVVETCAIGNFTFAQFAMWNDIHTAADKLESSDIVRSLLKGYMDWKPGEIITEEAVYLPISLDGTQLSAVKAAAAGETFILQGPPGTGKSQTITAMIANLIAKGKTVLFVAEKEAALNVVQRRLNALGLGGFCLELHSDKASKKHLLVQLDNALKLADQTKKSEYGDCLRRSADSRGNLDDYKESLHRKLNCGYSLFELIGLYETVSASEAKIPFTAEAVRLMTKNGIKEHIPLLSRLLAAGSSLGDISTHPLKTLRLTEYSIQFRNQLEKRIAAYEEAIKELAAVGDELASELGTSAPQQIADYRRLSEVILPCLNELEADPLRLTLLEEGTGEADAYLNQKEANQLEQLTLLRSWKPEFVAGEPEAYLLRLENANKKLLGKKAAISGIYGEIRTYALNPVDDEQIVPALERISSFHREQENVERSYQRLRQKVRDVLECCRTKQGVSDAYAEAQRFAEKCTALFGGMEEAHALAARLLSSDLPDRFDNALFGFEAAERALNGDICRANAPGETDLKAETAFCAVLREHITELKDLALYNQIRQKCLGAGLVPAVKAYEDGMGGETLVPAYRKGLYDALIADAIDTDPVIGGFSGATFSESVAQFRELDEQLTQQTKFEIFNRLAARLPSPLESPQVGLELSFLRKAISSGARGISIRILLEKITDILPRIAPCMLMSPDSVAQYLPQENGLFDVVIFDEASQLQTCKSVGALYRGKSAVIVGDDKQMPPTAFFESTMSVTGDAMSEDLGSILADVQVLSIPTMDLLWHYRSTHESLIAFSNNTFYDNRMHTFPSANDMERRVRAEFVGGTYKAGLNPVEAQAVVMEVLRRFRDPALKTQSVGIVTFNIQQRRLIEDLLAKQYLDNHDFDVWAHASEEEGLFVKNLENVQGDERDVILFSIGFGPDERGHVNNNFGPIIKDGGEKRLNVAFSRARVEMVIFTSMHSTDIRLTNTSSLGAVALHDFLRYAEGVDLPRREQTDAEFEADTVGVMNAICKTVTDSGLECRTQVGHSDIRVDIAVVDPYVPTRYMLGILLDGNTYRDTQNTRDREVSQLAVLSRLGWNLVRIWTIDWWDNSKKETEKLLAVLEKQRDKARLAFEAEQAEKADSVPLSDEDTAALAETLASQIDEVVAETDFTAVEEEPEEPTLLPEAEEAPAERENIEVEPTEEEPEAIMEPEYGYSDAADVILLDESESTVTTEERSIPAEGPESIPELPEDIPAAEEQSGFRAEPYRCYRAENQPMSMAEFLKPESFHIICDTAAAILNAEAPIQKELLLAKLRKAFSVKNTAASAEVAERAVKSAKPKLSKDGEIIFCWKPGTVLGDYAIARMESAAQGKRSMDEISRQELRNALCVVLGSLDAMEKEALLREGAKLLGFTRYTAPVAAGMERGFQYANTTKVIRRNKDGTYSLRRE